MTTDKPENIIKPTMDTLEQIRGYPSGRYGAEAKAIKDMQKLGYTAHDIVSCYTDMKKRPFWSDKALSLMSVKGQIGEWKVNLKPVDDRSSYLNQNLPPRRGA